MCIFSRLVGFRGALESTFCQLQYQPCPSQLADRVMDKMFAVVYCTILQKFCRINNYDITFSQLRAS